MAYRFQPGEPVPEAVRRIAREQLEGAVESLRGRSKRDEKIHDARKRVKKVRALLRLVRSALGDTYEVENARLREAGRALSELRDWAAVIETFHEVAQDYGAGTGQSALDSIGRRLLLQKTRFERKAHVTDTLGKIADALAESAAVVESWQLTGSGYGPVAVGFDRAFQRARKAMRRASRHSRSDTFHAWRRRVKDHWYHARLLEEILSGPADLRSKELKQLETLLGREHNLAVLRDKLRADPAAYGTTADAGFALRVVAEREHKLRADALVMGAEIYPAGSQKLRRSAERWRIQKAGGRTYSGEAPLTTEAAPAGVPGIVQ